MNTIFHYVFEVKLNSLWFILKELFCVQCSNFFGLIPHPIQSCVPREVLLLYQILNQISPRVDHQSQIGTMYHNHNQRHNSSHQVCHILAWTLWKTHHYMRVNTAIVLDIFGNEIISYNHQFTYIFEYNLFPLT